MRVIVVKIKIINLVNSKKINLKVNINIKADPRLSLNRN